MSVGELCNFGAYIFVPAVLVTPLGAFSVVVTAVLSAVVVKEKLSIGQQVACFNAIVGSIIIVLNAPEEPAIEDIAAMKRAVAEPLFLAYAGVVVVFCAVVAVWVAPKYGKRSMLIYLSICSLIGGLTVVFLQGLGAAVLAGKSGKEQYREWFLYVLIGIVILTGTVQIIYINKALNVFNTALVGATYYVFFTSATFVTSAILFRGFKATSISIATIILSFAQICASVISLQWFKAASESCQNYAEMDDEMVERHADLISGSRSSRP